MLHTSSQNLKHHPRLHCLVPTSGFALMTPAGSQPDATASFSRCACSAACSAASCSPSSAGLPAPRTMLPGKLAELSTPCAFHSLLGTFRRTRVGGLLQASVRRPEHVLKYLARYTRRVTMSNGRLLSLENGQVALPIARVPSRQPQQRHEARCGPSSSAASCSMCCLPGFVRFATWTLANRNRRQALTL